MPANENVRLRWSGENRICITPFTPVQEQKGPTQSQNRDRQTLADDGIAGHTERNGARHYLVARIPALLLGCGFANLLDILNAV